MFVPLAVLFRPECKKKQSGINKFRVVTSAELLITAVIAPRKALAFLNLNYRACSSTSYQSKCSVFRFYYKETRREVINNLAVINNFRQFSWHPTPL